MPLSLMSPPILTGDVGSGAYKWGFSLVSEFSAVAGGVLTDWFGYHPAIWIGAVVTLVAAILWLFFMPETRPDHIAQTVDTSASSRIHFSVPLVVAIGLLGLNWLLFNGILFSLLPQLLQVRVGESVTITGFAIQIASLTGMLTAANMVVSLLSAPLAGWLSDYTRNRWALVIFCPDGWSDCAGARY